MYTLTALSLLESKSTLYCFVISAKLKMLAIECSSNHTCLSNPGTTPCLVILFDQAETPLFDMELEASELNPAVEKVVVLGAVNNYNRVHATFKLHRPDIVFHAAAYKHVPMLEENPVEAIQTNIQEVQI